MTWKQKKRFMRVTATVFLIMLILVFAFASCGEKVTYECKEEEKIECAGFEFYEVGPFETLSHIAVKYIPSDDYMQEWIRDVQRLNNRDNSTIYFGEVIKVYVYEE